MRIGITLRSLDPGPLVIPEQYNSPVAGFIYNHLPEDGAATLHNEGYTGAPEHLRGFVFSKMHGRFKRRDGTLSFAPPRGQKRGSATFYISSVEAAMLAELWSRLFPVADKKPEKTHLGGRVCEVAEVFEVPGPLLPDSSPAGGVTARALSPVVSQVPASKRERSEGRTRYYEPGDGSYEAALLSNLEFKARVLNWCGGSYGPEPEGGRRIEVTEGTARSRGVMIKGYFLVIGYTGEFQLRLPPALLELAYLTGLGARNAQGFGMVDYPLLRGKGAHHTVSHKPAGSREPEMAAQLS